jgi:hypothetical protein
LVEAIFGQHFDGAFAENTTALYLSALGWALAGAGDLERHGEYLGRR